MSMATYILEVDWANDGAWTGEDIITADVRTIECRRGRDYASQLTGRSSAGRLMALLNNGSGKYSKFNSASPIYGNIVPGRKIRLRTTAPVAATLWTGFLSRIAPYGSAGRSALVTLEAFGPLSRLNGKKVAPAKQDSQLTGVIVGAILDDADWPVGDRTIAAGQTTVTKWFVEAKEALTALREIEETELGFMYEAYDGKLVYEDRHTRLKSPYITSVATFTDGAGETLIYRSIEQQDPEREIFNEVVAEVAPLSVAGVVSVLWTLQGETPTIYPGTSKTFVATYPNFEVGFTDGAYVDAWTTPVATTDYTVTGVAVGDIGVAVTKRANSMVITLTNNHATATATVTLLQARGDPVTRQAPVQVTASDATSQTAFGVRSYRLPGPWLPTTATAQDFVDYVVSRYKDPVAILTLGLMPNRNDTIMTQAFTREISDRVTIVSTGSGSQLGLNEDFFIEAISHRISAAGGLHETFFELSYADADAGYWILGTSALGSTTKLAY